MSKIVTSDQIDVLEVYIHEVIQPNENGLFTVKPKFFLVWFQCRVLNLTTSEVTKKKERNVNQNVTELL